MMSPESLTKPRVFTPWQVGVSCLLGGPAAATWLIASNFRVVEERKKQKLTFLFGVITILALFGLGTVMPKNSSGGVLAAVVAGIAKEITKRQQGSETEAFLSKGGRIGSWWHAVGVGLLSLIATLGIIGLAVFGFDKVRHQVPLDSYEISVQQIPAVFTRLEFFAKDGAFTAFVFSPGTGDLNPDEAINIQFSVEDGHIGFDWLLVGEPNVRDRAKYEHLAKALGYEIVPKKENGVRYLRTDKGDLPRLCESVLYNLYGKHMDSKIGLLVPHDAAIAIAEPNHHLR